MTVRLIIYMPKIRIVEMREIMMKRRRMMVRMKKTIVRIKRITMGIMIVMVKMKRKMMMR